MADCTCAALVFFLQAYRVCVLLLLVISPFVCTTDVLLAILSALFSNLGNNFSACLVLHPGWRRHVLHPVRRRPRLSLAVA